MSDIAYFSAWVFHGKEMSLDEKSSRVRDAVYQKINPGGMDKAVLASEPSCYVREVYPDFVIVTKGSEYFKVPYSTENGEIKVSDSMIPVEQVWAEKVQ